MAGITPKMVVDRVTEVIRQHWLIMPRPPMDARCGCGWTSDFPVSGHAHHVAEQIEADELLALMRANVHR